MNKRLLKYFWALPLLGMLSSCSESAVSEGSQNSRNAVQFAVTASKQTDTRATIVDNYLVKKKPFGLFAYYGGAKWTQNTPPATAPNFFNNQEVSHNGNNWSYSPLMFWTDDYVSFFGYWPKEGNVTSASAVAGEMPKVDFTQNMDASKMVDFITSNNAIDKTKNDGTINLEFNHVLTRLNFFARSDRDLSTTSTKIYITGLRVLGSADNQDSKLFNKATFVLGDGGTDGDGHWLVGNGDSPTLEATNLDVSGILKKENVTSTAIDKVTSAAYQASAVPVDAQGLNTELLGTVTSTEPDDVDANGAATVRQNYLFMIPPRGKAGIEDKDIMVELDYDVVTENPDINGLVAHNVGKRVSLKAGTLVQGKAYNIIFTVGLNVVDVDVNVADWDTDEIVNAPAVDAAQTADESGIIAAWHDLNDIKASLKAGDKEAANYFVINVKNMPSTPLDLRTNVDAVVDLSAFDLGDQVELLFGDADGKTTKYGLDASVPNGWFYDVRDVNSTERYIMTKVTNYITKVADSKAQDDIAEALNALNTEKGNDTKGIHYYAVNVYSDAPNSLDLSNTSPATTLDNFTDDDYIYIIFKTDGGATKTYTAPTGWEIKETGTLGKYRLQKKTASQTSNIAIGNTGFVAGSTINVNKK